MANINATLETVIANITAQTGLPKSEMKVVYIKNGGSVYYPATDAEGHLKLGCVSFRHQNVLTARAEKAAVRAQAKADRDAAKALAKAQAAAAKAQAKAEAAAAKATALASGQLVPEAESEITVIGANA